jgi:hypothetical protein
LFYFQAAAVARRNEMETRMTHATLVTSYRLFLGSRRRRPPGRASYVDLIRPTVNQQSGIATPCYFPRLPHFVDGELVMCELMFWNVRGSALPNHTAPPSPLMEVIGADDMSITAWYAMPAAESGKVEVRAFSIDDDDFADECEPGGHWLSPLASVTPAGARGGGFYGEDNDCLYTAGHTTRASVVTLLPGDAGQRFTSLVTLQPGAVNGCSASFEQAPDATGFVVAAYRNPMERPAQLDPSRLPRQGWVILGDGESDGTGIAVPLGGGWPLHIDPSDPDMAGLQHAIALYQDALNAADGRQCIGMQLAARQRASSELERLQHHRH